MAKRRRRRTAAAACLAAGRLGGGNDASRPGLFWAFSLFAKAYGHGRALEIARNVDQLPSVVVYSDLSLAFDAPVVETRITEPDSAYHFQYSGLRFLIGSGDKYFLIPDDWTRSDATIVLEERPGLRLEYRPVGAQDQDSPRLEPPVFVPPHTP